MHILMVCYVAMWLCSYVAMYVAMYLLCYFIALCGGGGLVAWWHTSWRPVGLAICAYVAMLLCM